MGMWQHIIWINKVHRYLQQMGCFGVQCFVMPIRGEELEPVVSRVWCLSDSEFVLKSWMERKSAPIFFFFFFCSPNCPFDDWCAKNRLKYCRVHFDQQCLRQIELPELTQERHPLLGLLIILSMLDAHFRSWKIVDPTAERFLLKTEQEQLKWDLRFATL